MSYVALRLTLPADHHDVLTAELAEVGFDAFEESEGGFTAYVADEHYAAATTRALLQRYAGQMDLRWEERRLARENWNQLWEQNFTPVAVGDSCYVRATFHPPAPRFAHQIVIDPKMSFGTGHHATTYLMLARQATLHHAGRRVLDVAGPTAALLTAERTALNFLQRLSGVATLARRFADAVAGEVKFVIAPEELVNVVAGTEAVAASARSGRAVAIG